jgi:signal transduction histidine kinase
MSDPLTQPALAQVLHLNADQLSALWAQRAPEISPKLAEQQPSVLAEWGRRGLDLLCAVLEGNSLPALEERILLLTHQQLEMGLDIGAVVASFLLHGEVAYPVVTASLPPAEWGAAFGHLNATLRILLQHFSQRFAAASRAHMQEQEQRTSLMLRAAQTASSSLELGQVLPAVADGMAAAAGEQQCDIYLLNQERGTLVWRAGTGESRPEPLDPAAEALARAAVQRKEPVPSRPLGLAEAALPNPPKPLLAVPLKVGERVLGVALIAAHASGHVFTLDDMALAWGIANAVALAVDNARLYGETRRRLAESQSLQRVATALLEKLNLKDVLEIVCTEAQQLTGALGSTVFLLDGDWLQVAFNTGVALVTVARVPAEDSLIGSVVRNGQPFLTNSPTDEVEIFAGAHSPTSLLIVPLRVEGEVIGALNVSDRPGGFTPEELRITTLFADEAAIAIHTARLHHRAEKAAVVEERQRLARDLHDSVAQGLYSVTLYAEASSRLLTSGQSAAAAEHLKALREISQEALREMRLLVFELHPPLLEQEGLVGALQARIEAVEARTGVQAELQVQGEEELPLVVKEELYRVAQEALNNVLRHAQAHHVTTRLHFSHDSVLLEIIDDGQGFVPGEREKAGFGLRGMAERIHKLGGQLTVQSTPGGGTQLRAVLDTRRTAQLVAARGW